MYWGCSIEYETSFKTGTRWRVSLSRLPSSWLCTTQIWSWLCVAVARSGCTQAVTSHTNPSITEIIPAPSHIDVTWWDSRPQGARCHFPGGWSAFAKLVSWSHWLHWLHTLLQSKLMSHSVAHFKLPPALWIYVISSSLLCPRSFRDYEFSFMWQWKMYSHFCK